MKKRTVRRTVSLIVRVGICAGILVYLFRTMDLAELRDVLLSSLSRWPWLIAGTALTFVALGVGVLRWHEILKTQGFQFPVQRVFSIFFIGQFFNAFMLGACGGDAARAFYILRDAPRKRTEAASTVFVDRAVGLFVLIVFCCAMIALRTELFASTQGMKAAAFIMIVLFAASFAALFALFRRNLFERWPLFQRLEKRGRIGNLIRRTYETFYLYRTHHRVIAVSIVYSLLNMLFLTLACFAFGMSIGMGRPFLDYLTFFPIITVLAAIPMTPGAIGWREYLFIKIFFVVGVSSAAAFSLSLLTYAGGVFWSLVGGLAFVGHDSASGRSLAEELKTMKSGLDDGAAPEKDYRD